MRLLEIKHQRGPVTVSFFVNGKRWMWKSELKPLLLASFQIFPDQRTHIFAKTHGKRTSLSLRLQMQRRRQCNRNQKRDPPWAPGRFSSFGPASTTFVRLHTLYIYCT